MGGITLASRVLGLARESVAANYFGAGAVWSAFVFAFTVPNLFRKLLGEGALSAAFIPVYAESVEADGSDPTGSAEFAAASINLLGLILLGITVVGEVALLAAIFLLDLRPENLLAAKLTAVMLPYAGLICGTAFLGGILQVHGRFAAFAATSIVLNALLIAAIVAGAQAFDLTADAGRESAVYWLAAAVLVAGLVQLTMLLPSLAATGVRLRLRVNPWTPRVRQMLLLSVPVAVGAGVLQASVLADRAISFLLMRGTDAAGAAVTHFELFGRSVAYPLAEGAAARLNWAQFMYQFPLGVFAVALATAIFPRLAREAAGGGSSPAFRGTLREGVEAALFVGLPASVGLVMVARPAVRVLFERGQFTADDTALTALSTAIYSAAVWAFSLQQIVNRAYYALHDATTPLVWATLNLLANLAIELPLLWTPLGEAGMAVGTLVTFSLQSVAMLYLLNRRVGGLGLRGSAGEVGKMLFASALMGVALFALRYAPGWPTGETTRGAAVQLGVMVAVGAGVYYVVCRAMGVRTMAVVLGRGR